MTVLITGVCGNTGQFVASELLEKGFNVIGLDLRNNNTEKVASRLGKIAKQHKKQFRIYWDDITQKNNHIEELFVKQRLSGIVHLAFVLPPFSEMDPEKARKINVEGTKYLIELAKKQAVEAPFIFSSSTTVFGPIGKNEIFVSENHPAQGTSYYTEQKLECEAMLQNSGLNWRILRFSAIMNPIFQEPPKESIKFGLRIPLETHVEPVHVKDVAEAVYHALIRQEASRKILIISGGKRNQLTYQEYLYKLLCGVLGNIGYDDIPWHKFSPKPYYLHWYDTTESEKILTYQHRTIEDHVRDAQKNIPWYKKMLIPLARKYAVKKFFP